MIGIDLSGKTTVVTGGARGIGAGVCRVFAQAGARVAVVDRDDPESRQHAEALAGAVVADGGSALALAAGVERFACLEEAAERTRQQWGPIDVLVTCAGTTSRFAVDDLTVEEWSRIVEVNLTGTFHTVKAVLPRMRRPGGVVVLIGSAAIVAGSGGGVHYAASKAALEGLCRGLTRELAPHGIRTNLVHPSLIETELLRQRHPDPAIRRELAREVPMRRLGQPEDVAHLVAFLASDLAGYIAGQCVYVDGGRTFCK
jgi:3-oxoacyl-[acyl-carrier protein] reductase